MSQPANIGPQENPRTSPSNVARTSPKDLIWSSWGRPEMTSRERPNLTFKGGPCEVDSWRPQDVLKMFLEDVQSIQTWMSQIFF